MILVFGSAFQGFIEDDIEEDAIEDDIELDDWEVPDE